MVFELIFYCVPVQPKKNATRSQFFTMWTVPKPTNHLIIFVLTLSNQLLNYFTSIHTNTLRFANAGN